MSTMLRGIISQIQRNTMEEDIEYKLNAIINLSKENDLESLREDAQNILENNKHIPSSHAFIHEIESSTELVEEEKKELLACLKYLKNSCLCDIMSAHNDDDINLILRNLENLRRIVHRGGRTNPDHESSKFWNFIDYQIEKAFQLCIDLSLSL